MYFDENPKDGLMDDLDGDGLNDYLDAGVLYEIIDELFGKPVLEPLTGGLGRYKKNRNQGRFIHVDVSGFRARWGD